MKRYAKAFLMVVALAVAGLMISTALAEAQPMAPSAMTAPTPMALPMAAPAAPPATAPVLSAMPAPAAMPAPVTAAPPAAPPAMAPPMAVTPAPTAEPKKPEPKKMSGGEIADLIFKILAGLASLIFTVLGGLGYMKWAKSQRFRTVQKYIDMAFPAVEALVAKTDTKVDDKLVEFLKMINESLRKAGQSELTDVETAAAKDAAAKLALAEKLKE